MRKLVFIDKSIEQLRADSTTTHSFLLKRLEGEYDRYIQMDLPELHPKKSTTYMGIAIVNLALLYLITEKQEYLEEAKRWMFAVTSYEQWGNAHLVNVDLSASWILFGLSLGFDWLRESLSESEAQMIQDKLILQASILYEYKLKTAGSGWSTNYWQNHNWINMTGLACAGYALNGCTKDAPLWVEESKQNFEIVFNNLAEDGSNYEGVVYWRYGGMWLFVYAHLVKQMEQIDYFKQSEYLKNTFFYRLYQAAPNLEETINFGDCHDTRSGHSTAVYYKIASEYNNEYAMYLARRVQDDFLLDEQYKSQVKPGILPEACFEYLWYNPTVKERKFDGLPLSHYFKDLGLIVIRSSWNEDAMNFSFKCSSPGGHKQWKNGWDLYHKKGYKSLSLSHHHPDNNSFVINRNNEYLVTDEGYNRNIQPDDHNTITVDGKYCSVHDVNDVYMASVKKQLEEIDSFNPLYFKGEITTYQEEKGVFILSGETAKIYDPSLKLYHNERTICTSSNNYFVLIDRLKSDTPHTYTFNLHTGLEGIIKDNTVIYDSEQNLMNVTTLYPTNHVKEITEKTVRAVMTTQEPDNFRETVMRNLQISNAAPTRDELFINVISLDSRTLEIHTKQVGELVIIELSDAYINDTVVYNKTTEEVLFSSTKERQEIVLRK